MAKVEMNAITQHFSGRLGDIIFRRFAGKLFAGMRPKPFTGPPTEGQIDVRLRFRKGISYAKAMMLDPVARSAYEQFGLNHQKSAFTAAVGDFFRSPSVDDIDLSLYKGKIGEKVVIMADDDVEVLAVQVVIRNQAGAIAEQGAAVLTAGKWIYTATTALPLAQTATVEVTAKDRPGNVGTKQKAYVP
jgi:hypothetical protein